MLFLPTFILALVQLFLAVLLLRVYPTSSKKQQVLLLFFISITLTAWTVVNTLLLKDVVSVSEVPVADFLNSIGYVLGGLAVWQIYNFSDYYPVVTKASSFNKVFKVIALILFGISFIEPIAGSNIYDVEEGIAQYQNGTIGLVYVLLIVVCLLLFIGNIRKSIKESPKTSSQSKNLMTGLILTSIQALVFILILPTIHGQEDIFYVIGYASPIFFVGFTSYALLKQQLFDFKEVAARATGYIFSTTFVLVLYVSLGFLLTSILSPDATINRTQFITNVSLSIALVLTYPIIKRGFDKFTNRFFFRDAYEPQLFLDELNKTLVSSLEIDKLLQKSSLIIDANLKSQSCSFYIRDTSYFSSRLLGDNQAKITDEEMRRIQDLLINVHKKVITTALEGDTPEEQEIIEILKKHNIEILARLVSTLDFDVAGIGYFVLGSKSSGNIYSTQDVKIIEIVANELVIAVENALRFEEIEQFNVTLQKKIDDATKALKKSNAKLLALDEAKDEFISMASHQLRTPLTSVKGYLSMLSEGDAGKLNETQRNFIDQAFVSSQRMVYLIADLLNVSRLKTGKFIIEPAPTYLPDVIESEIAQLSQTVESRGLTMKYDKPKEFPMLMLDETKIRQVVMNFTDNAIYYTPSGGNIELKLHMVGDVAEFTVTDTGLGVPKAEQPHLFTKFYRAGNARKARPDGTGLGLFMAKKVVVSSGGAIIFSSTEGKGSTFGFRFNTTNIKAPEVAK